MHTQLKADLARKQGEAKRLGTVPRVAISHGGQVARNTESSGEGLEVEDRRRKVYSQDDTNFTLLP